MNRYAIAAAASAILIGAGAETVAGELQAAVRAERGAPAVPRGVRVVPALPLRGVGKADREAVRRLLECG